MAQDNLVTRMIIALHDAEGMRFRVDPSYQCHTLEELQALVRANLREGRDPGLLVTEILGSDPQAPNT